MTYSPKSELVGVLSPSAMNANDVGVNWKDLGVIFPVFELTSSCYLGNGIVIINTQANHIWRSTDYGATWVDLGVIPTFIVGILSTYFGNGIVLMGGFNSGHIWRSTDFGLTWTDLGNVTAAWNTYIRYLGNGIAIDPNNKGHIWRSTDYGATWADLGDVTGLGIAFTSAFYLENGTVIACAALRIFRSVDYGANWAPLGIVGTASINSGVYLGNGIALIGNVNGHILRSTNYGLTWADLGIIAGASAAPIVYAGNGIAVFGDGNGHIWRSTNYGLTWSDLGAIATVFIELIEYVGNGILITGDVAIGNVFRSDVSYKLDEAQVNYPRIPVNVTASRALDFASYTNTDATRSLMISVYAAFLMTAGGGTAEMQALADTAAPPVTPISDNVGIVGGLNAQSNRISLVAVVRPGFNYRVVTTTANGTVTLLSWFETYI
jgi:photosystem II stability/assembly factor-like uncharacterized protein